MRKAVQRNKAKAPTLLIAAGGTGGHINPGISIAEEWLAQGGNVILATLAKNLDYPDIVRLARHEAVSIVAYDAPRLAKNPWRWSDFLRRFISAYRLVRAVVRSENAIAVVGMGGYSSFPAVLYAVCNRLPLFLCEQNAHWGIVTRSARFFARKIFLTFAPAKKYSTKYVVTGNPLRSIFAKIRAGKAKHMTKKVLFFIGGSQGAQDINTLYLAFAHTPEAQGYHCIVATGAQQYREIAAKGRKGDDIRPFVEDMPETLLRADYVIARCGSGTLSELIWAGKPALLLPYPFAAADHQRSNAESVKNLLDCAIYDERPFQKDRALAALLDFLASRKNHKPGNAIRANATAAQTEIVRYIKEELQRSGNR